MLELFQAVLEILLGMLGFKKVLFEFERSFICSAKFFGPHVLLLNIQSIASVRVHVLGLLIESLAHCDFLLSYDDVFCLAEFLFKALHNIVGLWRVDLLKYLFKLSLEFNNLRAKLLNFKIFLL